MTTLSILYFNVKEISSYCHCKKAFVLEWSKGPIESQTLNFFLCGNNYFLQLYGRIVFFMSRLENSYFSAGWRLKYDYSLTKVFPFNKMYGGIKYTVGCPDMYHVTLWPHG